MNSSDDQSLDAIIGYRVGQHDQQIRDHEDRIRKVENSIAKSAWLSGILTPLVTAIAVSAVLATNATGF
jgi:hypothetical protein